MLLIACGIGLTGILSAVSCLPAHLAFTSFSSGQTFSASSARNSNPLGPHRTRKLMFGLSAYDLVASCFCVGTQSFSPSYSKHTFGPCLPCVLIVSRFTGLNSDDRFSDLNALMPDHLLTASIPSDHKSSRSSNTAFPSISMSV
jgi:hypothetical protein